MCTQNDFFLGVVSQYHYEDFSLLQTTCSTDYTLADKYVKHTPSFFILTILCLYLYIMAAQILVSFYNK